MSTDEKLTFLIIYIIIYPIVSAILKKMGDKDER